MGISAIVNRIFLASNLEVLTLNPFQHIICTSLDFNETSRKIVFRRSAQSQLGCLLQYHAFLLSPQQSLAHKVNLQWDCMLDIRDRSGRAADYALYGLQSYQHLSRLYRLEISYFSSKMCAHLRYQTQITSPHFQQGCLSQTIPLSFVRRLPQYQR